MAEKARAMSDTGRIHLSVRKPDGGLATADRRVARTVTALVRAFTSLMFERTYRTISVADIAQRADVGRSTFYEHFSGKDAILLKSMVWMFDTLADAVLPGNPRAELNMLIAHYWENRRLARVVFAPPIEAKLRRALAAAIEERLSAGSGADPDPAARRIVAVRIAAGQLGLIEAWAKGEVTASAEQIADAVAAAARA
jgi:AcrR family transcriptional regulator